MAESLQDKIALVTGGSRGIGRAAALALAQAGANVAVNYLTHAEQAEQTRAEIEALGRKCLTLRADVSNSTHVAQMIDTVTSTWGPVEILINNAGITQPRSLDQIDERTWDTVLGADLKSAFLVTQAVLPGMRARRWGRIVFISSVAAYLGGVVGPHYAAAKAGMIGLMHSYASLLVKEGITANAIAPALIETDMLADLPHVSPDMIPTGRYGSGQEVAEVIILLAGDAYITGQTIHVNGGRYMT